MQKLFSSKHFTEANADAAKSEYANFLQTVVNKNRSSFQDFQVDEVGLDEFFMRYFDGTSCYSALVEIFKFVLILSHDQAATERGFGVNKNILVENLTEETFIGQHIVLDHIRVNNCNPNTVSLTRDLLVSARNSHRIYTQKLAERKKEALKNKTSQQPESINNEILALNQKKDLLENRIAELKKNTDERDGV